MTQDRWQTLGEELVKLREEFATPRRTVIDEAAGDFEDEDLIAREDMVPNPKAAYDPPHATSRL